MTSRLNLDTYIIHIINNNKPTNQNSSVFKLRCKLIKRLKVSKNTYEVDYDADNTQQSEVGMSSVATRYFKIYNLTNNGLINDAVGENTSSVKTQGQIMKIKRKRLILT